MNGDFKLGWLVGFFEGEASFGLTSKGTKNKRRYCRISVTQVQRQPLERLCDIAGGWISGPNGPYRGSQPNAQPSHQWRMQGRKAEALMNIVRPHMSPKRKYEIDEALKFGACRGRIPPDVK